MKTVRIMTYLFLVIASSQNALFSQSFTKSSLGRQTLEDLFRVEEDLALPGLSAKSERLLRELRETLNMIHLNASLLARQPGMRTKLMHIDISEYRPAVEGYYQGNISLDNAVERLKELETRLDDMLTTIRENNKMAITRQRGHTITGRIRQLLSKTEDRRSA